MDEQIVTYQLLMERVKAKITNPKDINLINKAYQYASSKHDGVKRLTGEDYINHPINVAYILTFNDFDAATICAGLLHDVIEDCGITREEIEKEFNKEIAFLVDGVTKINKLTFETGGNATIATQRKILVGLCEDPRVIIVKLADRLHNMRTLWVLPEKKQKEKARETLDILTPIAHRLGMSGIKSELEDLCLRYLKPDAYFNIVEQLNESKTVRDQNVCDMMKMVSELLNENGIKHEIKGRSKSIYGIYKKLDKGRRFDDIYDILALRVFVDTEAECYHALGIIHSKYRPIPKRIKDFIAMPKTNMYQSLHTTVFGIDGHLFEIQIRTYEMDEIAERGIAAHFAYKEAAGDGKTLLQNKMEQKLQLFRNIIELNNEESSDEEFVKTVTEEVFKDTIYVFTPKGDVIELPNGANPIDFAYKVHSGVGDKMVGAIVNNNIVPLDYKLKDNDIIKINTNQNSLGPSREWMNMAYTTQAKNKIKAFFNRIDKEEFVKKGEELLNKELRKKKIVFNDFFKDENVEKVLKEYKYNDLEELYINIGNGKLSVTPILNLILEENTSKEDLILKRAQNAEIIIPKVKNDIIVEGIDEIKVNVAACCKPIPGDSIIGYITKGSGITVHRNICPNVKDLDTRIIDVKWNTEINKKYPVDIIIHALKKEDLLLKIITKTSGSNVSIQKVNTSNHEDDISFDITILVEDLEHLNKFIADVSCITEILDIERVIR